MQLLLLKDISKLGHVGDIVEVTTGYARNYLVPQLLATEPTEENIQAIEEEKKKAAAHRARRLKEFESLAEQMAEVTVTIEAPANPEGTLYGSVHEKDIAEALQAQGFPVDEKNVKLENPIHTLDNRPVTLQFTDDISTEVKLWVVRAGGAAEDEHADEDRDDSDDDYEDDADYD